MFVPAERVGDYYEPSGARITAHKRIDWSDGAFGRVTAQGDTYFKRPSEGALLSLTAHARFHADAGAGLLRAPGAAPEPCYEDDWPPVSPGTGVPPPPPE